MGSFLPNRASTLFCCKPRPLVPYLESPHVVSSFRIQTRRLSPRRNLLARPAKRASLVYLVAAKTQQWYLPSTSTKPTIKTIFRAHNRHTGTHLRNPASTTTRVSLKRIVPK
jgi:hypothetical protein